MFSDNFITQYAFYDTQFTTFTFICYVDGVITKTVIQINYICISNIKIQHLKYIFQIKPNRYIMSILLNRVTGPTGKQKLQNTSYSRTSRRFSCSVEVPVEAPVEVLLEVPVDDSLAATLAYTLSTLPILIHFKGPANRPLMVY